MKNKEIIREGLEHCIANDCGGCPNLATEYCSMPKKFQEEVLDLINRQQAEHDELKNNYRETLTKQVELCDVIEKQQAEIEEHKKNCGKCGAKTRECIEGLQNNIAEKRAEIENYSHNIKNLTAENMQLHAEIKRLNSCVKSEDEVRAIMKSQMTPMVKELVNEQFDVAVELARADAIKELAGKIADVFCSHDKGDAYVREVVYNLVKEMVGK